MAEKIVNVEAGRGLAALAVVLFHADKYYFGTPRYWSGLALDRLFSFGHAGVEFFFVLSGYIMLTVHYSDIGKKARIGPFLRKRFERIYPFFWLILAVTVTMYVLLPDTGRPMYRDPRIIGESALLVGREPTASAVFVSWSMWHEVLFYGFCALVIGFPKVGIPTFLIWIAGCAVLGLSGYQTPWPPYLTAFVNVLFAFGVGAALILRRRRVPWPRTVLALGAIMFMGAGVESVYVEALSSTATRLMYGLGSALMLLGGVEAERRGLLRAPAWLVRLGAASFAIYLTHMLTLPFMAKAAAAVGLNRIIPEPLALAGLVGGAAGLGLIAHFYFEKPLIRAVGAARRRIELRLAPPAPAP